MSDRDTLHDRLDKLEDAFGFTNTSIAVVWRDQRTGELVDEDGEPTEPDPDADQVFLINDTVVMGRERAEREGHEILGPADVDQDDVVRVAWEASR